MFNGLSQKKVKNQQKNKQKFFLLQKQQHQQKKCLYARFTDSVKSLISLLDLSMEKKEYKFGIVQLQ